MTIYCIICSGICPPRNHRARFPNICSTSCNVKKIWADRRANGFKPKDRRKYTPIGRPKGSKNSYKRAVSDHERETRRQITLRMWADGTFKRTMPEEQKEKIRASNIKAVDEGRKFEGTMKGRFSPKYPAKYKGDVTKIFYRSSWELRVMVNLDADKNVLEWSSEEVVIPYKSPLDGRYHRYYVDFWVKNADGCYLLEVKPLHETMPPKQTKNTKRYKNAVATFLKNDAKWTAATAYCQKRGWKFQILSENDLGIK